VRLHNRPARRFAPLILLALLLSSLYGALPAGAQEQGGAAPPAEQKISASLAAAVAELSGPGLAAVNSEPMRDGAIATFNGLIQVAVVTRPAQIEAARAAIAAVGGEDMANAPGDESVQAWVPTGALRALAADPAVLAIRLPDILSPVEEDGAAPGDPAPQIGPALSQGVAAMGAGAWHSKGVIGRGVRVGVIDAEFAGAASLLGNELPAGTVFKSFIDKVPAVDTSGTSLGHGTKCAAIVADVAPGAQLYLATVATSADMLEAVNWMASQGVKVISMSMGDYLGAAGDGTGVYASLMSAAKAKGILMVVAAGNQRRFHWNGPFADSDGDQFLEFAPGVQHNCLRNEGASGCSALPQTPAGYFEPQLRVQLRWADSWTAPQTNLNLYLYRRTAGGNWVEVKKSDDSQQGWEGPRPAEYLQYTLTETGSSTPYEFAVAINRVSGPAPANVDLFVEVGNSLTVFNGMTLRYRTTSRSLSVIGTTAGALTVGAVDAGTLAQAPYSAEGPTNGPGGTAGVAVVKPDIMGYANMAVSSSSKPFEGTSAATPHVAGAAALVAQLLPNTAQPDYIRSYLTQSALDMGPAGKDSIYGAGRLRLLNIPSLNPYDGNFDGRADLFWRDYTYGNNSLMPASESGLAPGGAAMPNVPDTGWRVVGRGDLNGDGISDVVWRHALNGNTAVWIMKYNGVSVARESSLLIGYQPTGWRVMAVADFNGDGKADLLWQHGSGKAAIWLMNGHLRTAAIDLTDVPAGHTVYAGDFNADRRSDILLRNPTTGSNIIWLFDGAKVYLKAAIKSQAGSWVKLVGAADFDADRRADLLWRLDDGSVWVWLMKGTTVLKSGALGKIYTSLQVAGLADINGDMMADLVLRSVTGNGTAAVLVNGKLPLSDSPSSIVPLTLVTIPGPVGANWTIAGMAPYTASAAPAIAAEPLAGDDADLSQAGAEWPTDGPGELPALGPGLTAGEVLDETPPTPLPAAAGTTIYLPLLAR